ncbi:MAG: DUF72 domain-containing protein [Coriobacteriia bacterium]|nr:DUF72 domain-containing protein [Coriobacteriia bacterium]
MGTCSWTEKTMVDLWYPRGVTSPEQRLRYYASRFDTVEVDSSFYGIPRREYAEGWARRTPDTFIFHVKAYGMMTGHEVDVRSLPPELREFDHVVDRGRVRDPDPAMVDASFDLFLDAVEPLRLAGKLGGVLMQFPPYFTATTPENEKRGLDYIEYAASKLEGCRTLIEFRHPSWVDSKHLKRSLDFLADRGLYFVSVDSPQFPGRTTMPPISAVTGDWAYARFHGRNADTWFSKTKSSADRFDYLYSTEELREWEPQIRQLASEADETFLMFNNNKYDYAQRNAAEIQTILGDLIEPREPARGETPSLF